MIDNSSENDHVLANDFFNTSERIYDAKHVEPLLLVLDRLRFCFGLSVVVAGCRELQWYTYSG